MPRAQRDESPEIVDAVVPPGFSERKSADGDRKIQTNAKLGRDLLHHAIGRAVRDHRRRQELSKQELAITAGLSIGMLSRIENATVSPSLQTLRALAAALAMPLSGFFENYDESPRALFTRKSLRNDRKWHQNFVTFHQNHSRYAVNAALVELVDPSDEFFMFPQKGVRFIYVLEGDFTYRHGCRRFRLTSGDSLTCDSEVPQEIAGSPTLPVRFLIAVFHQRNHGIDEKSND